MQGNSPVSFRFPRNVSSGSRLNQTMHLADGRTLGFAEYGPPDGLPLFVFHGLPGSRLAAPELWLDEPTTVRVNGDHDANIPVEMAHRLATDIPDSSLTLYPGEGHLIVPRHWDEMLAALLARP